MYLISPSTCKDLPALRTFGVMRGKYSASVLEITMRSARWAFRLSASCLPMLHGVEAREPGFLNKIARCFDDRAHPQYARAISA
jgi:hypothetical protein